MDRKTKAKKDAEKPTYIVIGPYESEVETCVSLDQAMEAVERGVENGNDATEYTVYAGIKVDFRIVTKAVPR